VRFRLILQRLIGRLSHLILDTLSHVPPLQTVRPVFDVGLVRHASGATPALTYRPNYPAQTAVYTDDSLVGESTGSAFMYDGRIFSHRLTSFISAFIADLYAIYPGLVSIRRQTPKMCCLLHRFTKCLQSLSACAPDHPIVTETLTQVSHLYKAGNSVYCWVPGHIRLPGKEAAAKSAALHGILSSNRALGIDVSAFLSRAVLASWQDEWYGTRFDKLRVLDLIRRGMAILQYRQREGSHADTLADLPHTPNTWSFATW
jgi:hypothetical protein